MPPTSILVPIDFSTGSAHALDYTAELARERRATIHLLHAIGIDQPELRAILSDQMVESLRVGAYAQLERFATSRPHVLFGTLHIALTDPRSAILERATALGVDMIAMGTHGRSGIRRLMLGSVAEYIVRHAPCSVLTIPEVKE